MCQASGTPRWIASRRGVSASGRRIGADRSGRRSPSIAFSRYALLRAANSASRHTRATTSSGCSKSWTLPAPARPLPPNVFCRFRRPVERAPARTDSLKPRRIPAFANQTTAAPGRKLRVDQQKWPCLSRAGSRTRDNAIHGIVIAGGEAHSTSVRSHRMMNSRRCCRAMRSPAQPGCCSPRRLCNARATFCAPNRRCAAPWNSRRTRSAPTSWTCSHRCSFRAALFTRRRRAGCDGDSAAVRDRPACTAIRDRRGDRKRQALRMDQLPPRVMRSRASMTTCFACGCTSGSRWRPIIADGPPRRSTRLRRDCASARLLAAHRAACALHAVAYATYCGITGDFDAAWRQAYAIGREAGLGGDDRSARWRASRCTSWQRSEATMRRSRRAGGARGRAVPERYRERFAGGVANVLRLAWRGEFATCRTVLIALAETTGRTDGERALCRALLALVAVASGDDGRGTSFQAVRRSRRRLDRESTAVAYEMRYRRIARAVAAVAGGLAGDVVPQARRPMPAPPTLISASVRGYARFVDAVSETLGTVRRRARSPRRRSKFSGCSTRPEMRRRSQRFSAGVRIPCGPISATRARSSKRAAASTCWLARGN